MGCCSSHDRSPDNYHNNNDVGGKKKNKEEEVVRFFMIGMGSAGKSTVIKQLQKLCHERPEHYSECDEEWKSKGGGRPLGHQLDHWRQVVRRNVIDATCLLVKQIEEWKLSYQSVDNHKFGHKLLSQYGNVPSNVELQLEPGVGEQLTRFYTEGIVSTALARRGEMRAEAQIPDGTIYFLTPAKLSQVFAEGYVPSDDDIVHARSPTTGINDYRFRVHNLRIQLHDIGGQKVERAKTVNYINNWVSADQPNYKNFILYVVSMAEYDIPHPVHRDVTLLDESLNMMQLILELQPVQNCGFMIFFNKEDVFKEKIERCAVSKDHKDTTLRQLGRFMKKEDREKFEKAGQVSHQSACRAVAAKFAEAIRTNKVSKDRNVYNKITCAVDSKMMDSLFAAIQDELVNSHIDRASWVFP